MRTFLRRGLVLPVAAVAGAAALSPAAADAAQRVAVDGSVPAWAQAARDRGAADGTREVTVRVVLPLRDQAGADTLLQQVSSPDSATYGRYMSPQQFNARFAPTTADVKAVKSFLTGAGLTVEGTPGNRSNVEATGTLAQAAKAFGTDVHQYAYRGRTLDAPTRTLTVPAALRGKVVAVTGLDEAGTLTRPLHVKGDTPANDTAAPDAAVAPAPAGKAGTQAPPPDAFVNAPPCSTYFGEKKATDQPKFRGQTVPYTPCGYVPAQYRGAYGVSGLNANGTNGAGVTVAITDAYAAPTILTDARQYARAHGESPLTGAQYKQLLPKKPFRYGYDDVKNGDLCGEQGWYGEETLDVEAVHGVAPGANILYVASRSCDDGDFVQALNRIVSGNKANVISNSWGSLGEDEPADLKVAYDQVFQQAALQGIAVMFSSGDAGDDSAPADLGAPAVDFPSSEPYVTAVGGTALAVNKNNGYGGEDGWVTGTSSLTPNGKAWTEPTYLYGGGGGRSSLFAQPFYQKGHVPAAIAQGNRTTPDISMDADPQTGMLVGETQTFPDGSARYAEYRIGGTSLASPLFAGVVALADQAQGYHHGFVNPAIYAFDGNPAVHDIAAKTLPPAQIRVNYNNSVDASAGTTPVLRTIDDETQSLHQAPGWDNLTGIGTPNGPAFVRQLGRSK